MLPFGIGFGEVILIGVVLLLVVGPHKLPDLAKTVGKGLRVVRKAGNELRDAMQIDEVAELRRDIRREMYKPVNDWKDGVAEVEDAVVEPFQASKAEATAALTAAATPPADVEDAELELTEVSTSDLRARMQAVTEQARADAEADHVAQGIDDGLPEDDGEFDDDDDDHDGAGPTSIARHDPLIDKLRAENARMAEEDGSGEGST